MAARTLRKWLWDRELHFTLLGQNALFKQVAEEAAGGFCVHPSALDIIFVLSLTYASDLWI